MREPIVVLGATGSIGTQTLDILCFSFDYELVGVSFHSRYERLEPYLLYFDGLKYVAITDEKKAKEFHQRHPGYIVFSGEEANLELLKACKEATVFNALMGNCGLRPTLLALRQDQDLLLCNKESIVIGSELIEEERKHSFSHLFPVDSEHVALAKILAHLKEEGIKRSEIQKLTVTASGGSLRDYPKDKLKDVTPKEVLHHPTWSMGSKITVDSATLVNKGFEVIEAAFLFDFPLSQVGAIICRESLVHALVTYQKDGKDITEYEYSPCSMKVAIAYALSKGKLSIHRLSEEDEEQVKKLHFQEIDHAFYPCFDLTVKMFKEHGNYGMIYYNAVDTLAIASFLSGEISFVTIKEALEEVYTFLPKPQHSFNEENLSIIIKEANDYASALIEKLKCQH